MQTKAGLENFSLTSKPLQKGLSLHLSHHLLSEDLRIDRPYRGQRSLMYREGLEGEGVRLDFTGCSSHACFPMFCVGLFSIKRPDLIHCFCVGLFFSNNTLCYLASDRRNIHTGSATKTPFLQLTLCFCCYWFLIHPRCNHNKWDTVQSYYYPS